MDRLPSASSPRGGGGARRLATVAGVAAALAGSLAAVAWAASDHAIAGGHSAGKTVEGTIAKLDGHCPSPKTVENLYLATFSMKTG